MSSSQRNDLETFNVICPYCHSLVILEAQVLKLYIYVRVENEIPTLVLNKKLSTRLENRDYLKSFIVDSFRKKPFIAKVVITKPYRQALDELIKCNFLTNKDRKDFNLY